MRRTAVRCKTGLDHAASEVAEVLPQTARSFKRCKTGLENGLIGLENAAGEAVEVVPRTLRRCKTGVDQAAIDVAAGMPPTRRCKTVTGLDSVEAAPTTRRCKTVTGLEHVVAEVIPVTSPEASPSSQCTADSDSEDDQFADDAPFMANSEGKLPQVPAATVTRPKVPPLCFQQVHVQDIESQRGTSSAAPMFDELRPASPNWARLRDLVMHEQKFEV